MTFKCQYQFVKTTIILILLLFVGILKSTSQTPKYNNRTDSTIWEFIVVTSSKRKWYLNRTPIVAEAGHVRAWIKIVGSSITIKGKIYKNVEELWLMDFFCNKQTSQVVELLAYNTKGELLLDDRMTYAINIVPESAVDDVAQVACYNFKD